MPGKKNAKKIVARMVCIDAQAYLDSQLSKGRSVRVVEKLTDWELIDKLERIIRRGEARIADLPVSVGLFYETTNRMQTISRNIDETYWVFED